MKSNRIEKDKEIEQQSSSETTSSRDQAPGGMDIILRYRGLRSRAIWQKLVEMQLRKLQDLAAIASARVFLEWDREVRPAFRVLALLEVPGPDFHAEASDHTLQAALLKVVKNLHRQIEARKKRRAGQRRTRLQLGLTPGRVSQGLVGARA
jgi:ribosome-associated translation inhibitor RaiA